VDSKKSGPAESTEIFYDPKQGKLRVEAVKRTSNGKEVKE
jgi:hypothetical protein